MKLLSAALLLLGISAALASCPNDCSGHGACNQYSACECYRNYMGADCSERMCAFGKAFVDTPQGDLNADGVVERPDTLTFVLGKTSSFFEEYSTWADEAQYMTTPALAAQAVTCTGSLGADCDNCDAVTVWCAAADGQGVCDGGATGKCMPAADGVPIATDQDYVQLTCDTVGTTDKALRTDEWQGYYLQITFASGTVETREIVMNTACAADGAGVFTVQVSPAFDFRNPASPDAYKIMPGGTTAATFPATAAGCTRDGADPDCGGASFFTLKDFPAHGAETMYRFLSPVAASSEMTAAGGAGGVTGITTTAAPTVIADCNTKFATNSITHAIRVHVKAESLAAAYNAFPANTVVGDPLNDQRQVPEWGTPADADTYTASAVTAAEGVVEQLSLFPETFRSPVAKTNRWETEVQTTGALDNSATVFEVRAEVDVAFSVADGTIATSAYSSGDGSAQSQHFVGARVTVCFGIDEDGVPQAADQTLALTRGRGNCESRAIYEYGHNAASTPPAAAANYVTVRTPFSQIPSLGDLVFFDWLDLYGPSGLVNRNGVADTTDDYGGSGAPKIFVCSPGAGTPAGSEVKTQWDPDTAWESFPDEHGHARFGTGMASMSVTSAVNAGESTNAVQVTKKSYWDEAHFYRECSAKGSCDRSSGKCDCFPGYAGTGCAQLACPNDCSGHGQCRRILDTMDNYVSWDVDKTTKCVCESGYSGLDCSQRKCPMGDDPVTRTVAASAGMNEIQSFGVASAPHKVLIDNTAGAPGGQGRTVTDKFAHNMFALEFEDEMGDKWVTHQIDFTTGNHAYFWDSDAHVMRQPTVVAEGITDGAGSDSGVVLAGAADFTFHNLAADKRPDSTPFDGYYVTTVVEAVDASDDLAIDTAQIPDGTYADATNGITWTANPWAGGGVVSNANVHTTIPDTAYNYFVTTKDYTKDYSLAKRVETALESLPNNVIENVEVSVDLHVDVAGDADPGALTVRVTFLENSGDVEMMGVRYCWQLEATPTESNVHCNGADGSFANAIYAGTGTSVAPLFTIAETKKGGKENVECSNRGLCDYGTGLCKCFNGYTDFDCSVQNSLASS